MGKRYIFAVFTDSASTFYDGSPNELKRIRSTFANRPEYRISPIVKEERIMGKGDMKKVLHDMIFNKGGGRHGNR